MDHRTLAEASWIAYDDEPTPADIRFANMGFPRVRFFEDKKTDTQAYIASNRHETIVVFRGTSDVKDWLTNLNTAYTPFLYGRVHAGFLKGMESVFSDIQKELANPQIQYQKIYVTGHSLGAALSTLFAAAIHDGVAELVTFGSPRAADSAFIAKLESRIDGTRYVNNNDVVTSVPSDIRFEHWHNMVYFDPKGRRHPCVPWYIRWRENIKGRFQKDGHLAITDGLYDHGVQKYLALMPSRRQ